MFFLSVYCIKEGYILLDHSEESNFMTLHYLSVIIKSYKNIFPKYYSNLKVKYNVIDIRSSFLKYRSLYAVLDVSESTV